MIYPKLPRDLKRNVKVTKSVEERMRVFRAKGFSLRKTAKELGLSYTTVQRYLMSPEKREVERLRKVAFHREYRAKHVIKRNLKTQSENRKYRKEVLGERVSRYASLANMKNRYKTAKPQELFKLKQWHEKQIANLLEIEPLLVLIK